MNEHGAVRSNLDKLLLVFLILVFLGFSLHTGHDKQDYDSGLSQFVMQITGQTLAALLTLVTVERRRMSQSLAESSQEIANAGGSVKIQTTAEIPKPERGGQDPEV